MKRSLFLSLFFLFFVANAHAVNEMWSSATQSNLDDARRAGDSKYKEFKQRVDDHACSYDDYGLQHAIMYKATGDASYCREAYFNNGGCVGGANRNKTRDCFVDRALSYSICADKVPANDKKTWETQLDNVLAQVQVNNHGTRPWDSDELNGHYFGGTIYCLAKSGNLSACKTGGHGAAWGGVDATGDNRDTLRNAINHYYTNLSGGTFVEGSEYNQGTLYYAMQGVNAINDFYGEDKFPEITGLFDEFADFHVQYHTPDFSQNFAFGDIQKIGVRYDYRVRTLYAAFAHLDNDDPEMWYLWNRTYADECVRMGWGMFYDHNAQKRSPSGQTDFFAEGTGIQLWHEGWENSYESFYASKMKSQSNADHDANGWTNFNLWRNGNWAIHNGKGYYGSLYAEANYLNTMLVNGGLPYVWQEARGTHVHEEGSNFAYHVGLTGGNSMYGSYYNPPPESLHEWTRSHFYYKHKDDSDTIIVFDRVNAKNPKDLANFSRHTKEMQDFVNNADGKHSLLFQAAANPTQIGNRITWFSDSSETVYLDTFIPKFSYSEEFMNGKACAGCGGNMGENNPTLDYRIVLRSEDTAQHQSFGNVLHVGSTPLVKEIRAQSGEAARAYHIKSGADHLVAVFNGADRTNDLPTPTTKLGEKEKKDSGKFDDLKDLHFFKEGFSLSMNTGGNTDVFLLDLNPGIIWKLSIDGATAQTITPSEAGLYQTQLKGSGTHTIVVNAAGVSLSQPDDSSRSDSDDSGSDNSSNPRSVTGIEDELNSADPLIIACEADWTLCTSAVDCKDAGWLWNGVQCQEGVAEPCDTNCAECTAEVLCENSDSACYWWANGTCRETDELCARDSAKCQTEADCTSNDYFWCDGVCRDTLKRQVTKQDSCTCQENDTDSLSCKCTVTECSDQVMVIAVGREERGDKSPNSITWNGRSVLSNYIGSHKFWFQTGETEMYYLLDPQPGTHRLAITYDKNASVDVILGMSTTSSRPSTSNL